MSEVKEKILNTLKSIHREGMEDLINWLLTTDFFECPASTKYHNAFDGGLADHSWKVYELFKHKNEFFNLGLSEDTVAICALMHDLTKANFYKKEMKSVLKGKKTIMKNKKDDSGKWVQVPEEVNDWQDEPVYVIDDQMPLGHASKSVILLQKYIDLSDFEIMSILFHMGLPEDYDMKCAYNKAVEKYPAIIALHSADLESSYLLEEVKK